MLHTHVTASCRLSLIYKMISDNNCTEELSKELMGKLSYMHTLASILYGKLCYLTGYEPPYAHFKSECDLYNRNSMQVCIHRFINLNIL